LRSPGVDGNTEEISRSLLFRRLEGGRSALGKSAAAAVAAAAAAEEVERMNKD
jgi:hypothetical protein